MSLTARLRQDALMNRVLLNSAHLFSSNSISLVLSFIQGILAARLLGLADYGLLVIVMAYASTVNGLLSFRMSELVVRYGGEYLEQGEKEKAGALIKMAGISEAVVSVLAFLLVALTAGIATRLITKEPGTEWMIVLFAVGLLANFNAETSTGILQITDKIRIRGVVNLLQTILSVSIIGIAFLMKQNGAALNNALLIALLAYLLGKSVLGLGLFTAAQLQLRHVLGSGWTRSSFAVLHSLRELFRFAFSSNLSATAILIFRESEILWVGFFLNQEAAALYKTAYTIVSLLSVPADPLILAVYPELNRLVVQQAWPNLRKFLRSVTAISFAYNALFAAVLVVLGPFILSLYGKQYIAAYPTMLTLLAGMAFNYTLFWNRPMLLSLGLPTFPLWATLFAGLVKLGLSFPLVPRYGIVMEAALLSFYYVLSVGLIVWHGLRELRRRERAA
ncbi:MAG TPA: oligosaccharide flippase family protein [Anaerolineales bacterium]|nr:oligosaccharide flippase family protein [Anaerolineales bacterium]